MSWTLSPSRPSSPDRQPVISASPPPLSLRQQLQRQLGNAFLIERELAGGASAHIFRARDTALDRAVVIKVLSVGKTADMDAERFRREIHIAAKLQHPHLVPLLASGSGADDAGRLLHWYSMPFIEGETLHDLVAAQGALPLTRAMPLLRALASGLAYAHARGVIHRDIKPENILLCEGVAMITDFGVAKALDDSVVADLDGTKRVTSVGATLGTPAYMSPEQINEATNVDHRADLYAFGCVAYELLTGAPPFAGRSLRATMLAQVSETPVPLQSVRPDIPAPIAELLARCLEKAPHARPHSATAIVRAIDALVAGAQPTVEPASPTANDTVTPPPPSQHQNAIWVGLALAGFAAVGYWWS